MKKILLLLLCLVITVSSLGIAVSAEAENQPTNSESIVEVFASYRTKIMNMLSRYGIVFATSQNQNTQENGQPQSPETQAPDVNEDSAGSLHAYELRVIELVNAERAKYGLSALKASEELSSGARLKSKDMHDNGYFSHNSPTYGSPFDMMKSLGITYRKAGENIAKGYQSPEAVVNAWMNSEGHRANILNASYTEIGVGYIPSGGYYTQWFRG